MPEWLSKALQWVTPILVLFNVTAAALSVVHYIRLLLTTKTRKDGEE